jgi:hypothetical protein
LTVRALGLDRPSPPLRGAASTAFLRWPSFTPFLRYSIRFLRSLRDLTLDAMPK